MHAGVRLVRRRESRVPQTLVVDEARYGVKKRLVLGVPRIGRLWGPRYALSKPTGTLRAFAKTTEAFVGFTAPPPRLGRPAASAIGRSGPGYGRGARRTYPIPTVPSSTGAPSTTGWSTPISCSPIKGPDAGLRTATVSGCRRVGSGRSGVASGTAPSR